MKHPNPYIAFAIIAMVVVCLFWALIVVNERKIQRINECVASGGEPIVRGRTSQIICVKKEHVILI